MLDVRRRCAQTARISLHFIILSKSDRPNKNEPSRQFPSVSPSACPSDFPERRSGICRRSVPSPSRFRFGEAVFTEARRKPQEGKIRVRRFFSGGQEIPLNLGVALALAH
jgi:hypothetical protein